MREPDESAHIVEPDRSEYLSRPDYPEPRILENLFLNCQIQSGKRLLNVGKHEFHQVPVVLVADLLCDEHTARFEDTV